MNLVPVFGVLFSFIILKESINTIQIMGGVVVIIGVVLLHSLYKVGSAPKFPTPHNLLFLLRYWRRAGDKKAIAMVVKTLDAMSRGGIYDHLGYGFARYSTDNKWLAPHFEKMLYDNALLCYAYVEAYQCTTDPDFARIAEEIISYVLRDMTNADGAFYSGRNVGTGDLFFIGELVENRNKLPVPLFYKGLLLNFVLIWQEFCIFMGMLNVML